MKKNKILYIIVICFTFASCSKWLTVEPSDQVSQKNLYSDADGFYNQVNGLYKEMASSELYGREMTWGLVDVLAQYYNTARTNNYAYKKGAEYDYGYDRTKNLIEPIWSKSFNIIANCNDLIRATEEADSMLFTRRELERRLILGEAHAIRAYLHFDVLRLFAPAPVLKDNGRYVPYLKEFPTHMPVKQPTEVVLENVINDLLTAEKYVFKHDSTYAQGIRDISLRFELQTGAYERYTMHRGYRMNIMAIKALLARVYLYQGNKEAALAKAEEVLYYHEREDYFSFTSEADIKSGNVKMYDDLIFALYNNRFLDYVKDINIDESTNLPLWDFGGIFGYESEKDYRARYQWRYNSLTGTYAPLKIAGQDVGLTYSHFNNKMIPMIRLSEMYYIISECIYDRSMNYANTMIEHVREARGVKDEVYDTNSQQEFNEKILLDEFRREMYAEGQLFFFYKRLNMKILTYRGAFKTLTKEFVLPIPDSDDIN